MTQDRLKHQVDNVKVRSEYISDSGTPSADHTRSSYCRSTDLKVEKLK